MNTIIEKNQEKMKKISKRCKEKIYDTKYQSGTRVKKKKLQNIML